jgi:hypothetical protein
MLSGIASSIAQGMAFGGGSAIAHRAVDAVMGPRELKVSHEGAPAAAAAGGGGAVAGDYAAAPPRGFDCSKYKVDMDSCFADNTGNIALCQPHVDLFRSCQRGETMRD